MLAASLEHLSQTLTLVLKELPSPFGEGSSYHPLYSPFLARSLLEVSFTALVARSDPFRISTIAYSQSHSAYTAGEPNSLAFRWQGDVLLEADAKKNWVQNAKPREISRSLLGDCQDQVFWRSSFIRFLDAAGDVAQPTAWMVELLGLSAETFTPYMRSRASRLFSSASKGVHHEFVIPISSYYDQATLAEMVEEAIRLVASLAVVANFCEHYSFRVSEAEALDIFQKVQS